MIICSHCSTVNHSDNVVCSHCGSPLAPDPALEGDPYIGRTLGGRFALEAIVGSGEIGMVYRGTDRRSGAVVAVKIVHPDVAATLGDDLLQAASVLAKLRHAKIATVLGAARASDGTTFIVTEYLEGQTLKNLLENNGPVDARRTADILFQLCSALAPIHRSGRPHANLKPENVFLVARPDGSDFVKIVDAGSPKLFGVRETSVGEVIVGTPKYFSPEQALGRAVSLPSDQFSLGIIGYQLLTGALPFFGATPDQLLSAIANGAPTPVGQRTSGTLPEALAHVIHRCLEKAPGRRYSDLRALATELAGVIKTTQPAPLKRKRFGEGVDASTMVAGPELLAALSAPDDDDDDDEATVMRSLPMDIEAAMRAVSGTATQLFAEPAPAQVTPEPSHSIPEPLMFTGALEQSAIQAQLASSGGAARRRASSAPAAAAPSLDHDLNAAMAAAAADAGARAMPGPPATEGFDPFGDMNLSPEASAQSTVRSSVSQPPSPRPPVSRPPGPRPAPSPELSNAIFDAINEELGQKAAPKPRSASPLATAADFAALSPEVISQARPPEAGKPARSRNQSNNSRTLLIALAAVLILGIAGGAVWYFVLREPVAPETQRTTQPKPTPKPAIALLKSPLEIELRSTPAGAEVFQGAKRLGKTPLPLTLSEARAYAWVLKLDGHPDTKHSYDPTGVLPGETTTPVEVILTPAVPAKPGADAAVAPSSAPSSAAAKPKRPKKPKPIRRRPKSSTGTKASRPKKPAKPKQDPKKLRDPFETKAKKLKNPFD
jgi:serine/threonine-protein kinase